MSFTCCGVCSGMWMLFFFLHKTFDLFISLIKIPDLSSCKGGGSGCRMEHASAHNTLVLAQTDFNVKKKDNTQINQNNHLRNTVK